MRQRLPPCAPNGFLAYTTQSMRRVAASCARQRAGSARGAKKRRRLPQHPRRQLRKRSIGLLDDDQIHAVAAQSPLDRNHLPRARVKAIVNLALAPVFAGSMKLFRAARMIRMSVPFSGRCVAKLWRKACSVTRLARPASSTAARQAVCRAAGRPDGSGDPGRAPETETSLAGQAANKCAGC